MHRVAALALHRLRQHRADTVCTLSLFTFHLRVHITNLAVAFSFAARFRLAVIVLTWPNFLATPCTVAHFSPFSAAESARTSARNFWIRESHMSPSIV